MPVETVAASDRKALPQGEGFVKIFGERCDIFNLVQNHRL